MTPLTSSTRPRRLMYVAAIACCAAAALQVAELGSQSRQSPSAVDIVDGHEVVPGEVLVQFHSALDAAWSRQAIAAEADASEDVPVGRRGLRRIRSRSRDVRRLLAMFRSRPGVVFAEPNYVLRGDLSADDAQFPTLWGLLNVGQTIGSSTGTPGADIDATSAWDISTGSREIAVGVIDSGIDYTHPDLAANVWSAPSAFTVTIGGVEIACPAGSHGFNAITRTCDPMDTDGHGTHVAGTIGAVGNNGVGVAGVNWTTSIIAAKFLHDSVGTTADAIDAIEFMIQVKAAFAQTGSANIRVLNNSWGGGSYSLALREAILAAERSDMLFVAAAGNGSRSTDAAPHYPASYDLPSIVAVAATTNTDVLAPTSNYGGTTVDVAAPGSAIWSTFLGNSYAFGSGTSMAAPHVAGAATLVLSECALDTESLKRVLLTNVDVIGSLAGRVATGGRLNVNRAIRACGLAAVPAPPEDLAAVPGDTRVDLRWTPSAGATSYRIRRSVASGGPYSETALVNVAHYSDTAVANGTTYYYVVSALSPAGESARSLEASATPFPGPPLAPEHLKAQPADARITLGWDAVPGAASYRVRRSTARFGPYAVIGETAVAAFSDDALNNGTRYFYLVTALNTVGESGNSNRVSAVPAPVPPAPGEVVAATGAAAGTVDLSWAPAPWAGAYKIWRAPRSGGRYAVAGKVAGLSFTDAGRLSGREYFYVVTAVNTSGQGPPSIEVSATAR